MENLVANFFAAAVGQAKSVVEKDGVVLVKAIARKGIFFFINVGQSGEHIGVPALVEIVSSQKIILQA